LPRSFFERAAVDVAPALLGRTLVRRLPDGTRCSARIVETEAYEPGDPASHAFRGVTRRNAVMFGPAGCLYVFFTYGSHHMLNVVTRRAGLGSAVLLRAAEPLEGISAMAEARGRERVLDLCSGPGRLAQALSVTLAHDGADLVRGEEIWLEAGTPAAPEALRTSPRVGISVGLEPRWRYFLAADAFVSRGRPGPPARKARHHPTTVRRSSPR
jgi:DNA-3-methyladenine glycosylase